MNRHILVVVGHPIPDSLNHALADAYAASARKSGADVRVIDLAHDPIPAHPQNANELRMPRADRPDDLPLDADVARYISDVEWADHITVFHPQWWGTAPAALKAFIDRVFLAGFAFSYRERSALPIQRLKGRTARIVMTMDSPRVWNRLAYRGAAEASLSRATFGYCGIRTVGITRHTPVRFSDERTRERWLTTAAQHGLRDARSSRRVARTPAPNTTQPTELVAR